MMSDRILAVMLVILLIIVGCIFFTNYEQFVPNQMQVSCEHEWVELYEYSNPYVLIYCPKCQLAKEISLKKWRKMQVDQRYYVQ